MLAYGRTTRAVTEAVIISSLVSLTCFAVGVAWGEVAGAYVATAGFGLGAIAQALWLRYRSRPVAATIEEEDPFETMAAASP
jgi:Ca2+/Na+ antiporter